MPGEACLGISLVIWVIGDERWAVQKITLGGKFTKMCYISLTYGRSLLHLGTQLSSNQEPWTPRDTRGVDREADAALVCGCLAREG